MASIKIKYRESNTQKDIGSIYFQIIHNRETKNIKTSIKITNNDWANKSLPDEIEQIEERIKSSIHYLEQLNRTFTVTDIINAYNNFHKRELFVFMEQAIDYLKSIGKYGSAETYASTLRSLKRFRNNKDIELIKIDSDFIKSYEAYLLHSRVQPNTVAFYMRIFRAVYNRAEEKGLLLQRQPFKTISTRAEKTIKRAITVEELKALKDEDLSQFPPMELARDIFMFSFYTRGMSFVDMAYLRKKDLNNGVLSYRRRKTNQLLYIKWEQPMQEIVDKYFLKTVNSPYLLPIISNSARDEERQYKLAIHTMNYNLKRLAKLVGITTNLTSYCSRHTWASIARSKNIPISVISEGMGHENEKTTQIYLASLDNRIIDNANFTIISDL